MKKTIAMVVLVVLLLGGANALVDNKIEKMEKELTQVEEKSRFEVTQDELILLAIKAGATDIIIEQDTVH